MIPGNWQDPLVLFIGLASMGIGLVALVETHRESAMCQRWATGILVLLCGRVALDGLYSWFEAGDEVEPIGALFAFVLGVTWALRVWFARRPKDAAPDSPA
jgi:threonine/homoserine efflux transporter RhtA